jgi:hypothetical protein
MFTELKTKHKEVTAVLSQYFIEVTDENQRKLTVKLFKSTPTYASLTYYGNVSCGASSVGKVDCRFYIYYYP